MTDLTEREKQIVAWLRGQSRANLRIAYETWAEARQTNCAGDKGIGDSIFALHKHQDQIADAIERGEPWKDSRP